MANLIARYQGNLTPGRLIDSSGSGNDLTQVGSPLWPSVCQVSGSEGSNALIGWDTTTPSNMNLYTMTTGVIPDSNGWTIYYQMKTNASSMSLCPIVIDTNDSDNANERYLFPVNTDGYGAIEYSDISGVDVVENGTIIFNDGNWHRIKLTGDTSSFLLYIDDAVSISGSTPLDFGTGIRVPTQASNLAINPMLSFSDTEYAYIDNVQIYNGYNAAVDLGTEGECIATSTNEYRIVYGNNRADLQYNVTQKLLAGYICLGGVLCAISLNGSVRYMQAMVLVSV